MNATAPRDDDEVCSSCHMTMAQSRLLAAFKSTEGGRLTEDHISVLERFEPDPPVDYPGFENELRLWNEAMAIIRAHVVGAEEKRLRLYLAAEKRKTLELQRVYDERGRQIARLEVALERAEPCAIRTVP
jgi:hypothetical protein